MITHIQVERKCWEISLCQYCDHNYVKLELLKIDTSNAPNKTRSRYMCLYPQLFDLYILNRFSEK